MTETILGRVRALVELLHLGDAILVAIFLCSVIALGIFLERIWSLRERRVLPPTLLGMLDSWLKEEGTWDEARAYCRAEGSTLARILIVLLQPRPTDAQGFQILREQVEEAGREEALLLEGHTEMLGTLSHVATLLGLFGTVVGMVEIFDIISAEGAGRGPLLAGGIATALLTTVFGLAVAIPSLVAYRFCQGRIRAVVLRLEQTAHQAVERLRPRIGRV